MNSSRSRPSRQRPPLGNLTAAAFLRTHWAKRPCLVRHAFPGFAGFLDRKAMQSLALRDDVESRLIVRAGRRWELRHGPLRRGDFTGLPEKNWTLLVQGVNLHLDEGARLLRYFDFVPHARLDDLMVSIAAPGGGVGPHFDSYDVFLLQGPGRRRWRISAQTDLTLRPGLPLRILGRFMPEQDWTLDAGDMLYLPPRYAHDGVAVDECLTYSIGFRAPAYADLVGEFLSRLDPRDRSPGRYEDPDLAPARHPGRLPATMTAELLARLKRMNWRTAEVEDFLGCYLSEPKPHVFFDPVGSPPSPAEFRRRIVGKEVVLDRRSIMLYSARSVFLNGEVYRFPRGIPPALRDLADARCTTIRELSRPLAGMLLEWFANGFLQLATDNNA